MKRYNIKGLIILGLVLIASVLWISLKRAQEHTPQIPASSTSGNTAVGSQNPTPQAFDKTLYSIDEADSIWVIVNKQRQLENNFTPPDLVVPNVKLRQSASAEESKVRQTAASAIEEMFRAAEIDGIGLLLASGFRSQSLQTTVYNRYVQQDGQAAADRYSARPGFSEHQTGLAFDVGAANRQCEIEQCFADLAEGQWVAANAANFGFIIRYGRDQEALTGYMYEPWHLRFVGKALATELNKTGQTMEQFFGLPAATDY